VVRSAELQQGFETGSVRLGGYFPSFEERAVQWQAGQHQPDSLAALVVAHDVLAYAIGRGWAIAAPVAGVAGRVRAKGSGLNDRIGGRPDLESLMADIKAEADADTDVDGTGTETPVRPVNPVTSMASWMSRRASDCPSGRYDPMRGFQPRAARRTR
jgi:hypothetical protein